MMKIYFIDTFTNKQKGGNPTVVCLPAERLSDQEMQTLAGKWDVPVSAFLYPRTDGRYDIRYFTIITEIPACGHATLAAARAVFENDRKQKVSFVTVENVILGAEQRDTIIVMTYPRYELISSHMPGDEMLAALQLRSFQSSGHCVELSTLFIELDDPQILRNIQPEYDKLVNSNPFLHEIVVTSVSDDPAYDYLLRSFCPWIGINEDPVTGSVHAVLAGFWEKRLHKKELVAWQASPKGGKLFVRSFDDKVELGGESVIVSRRDD